MMSDRIGCLLKEKCPTLLMGSVNLESSNLLANLVAKGVITQTEKKFIKAQGPDFKQVETLVDILLTKCDADVYKFIDALEDSELYGVARELRSLCKEEASHFTGGATGGRQEKTLSVKAKVSAECRPGSSPKSEDETETRGVDNDPCVTSDARGSPAEERCSNLSLETDSKESMGKDNNKPDSPGICKNREECSSPSNLAPVDILEDNILAILKTKQKQHASGDKRALPIMIELTSVYREVISVRPSSILFIVKCPSLAALHDLKEAVESGRLRDSFIKTFFTPERLAQCGILSADVHISLDEMEYIQCEQELIAEGPNTQEDKPVHISEHAYSTCSFHQESPITSAREVEHETAGQTPMTDFHKERLTRCYSWLADQVQDEHIVEQLISENIFTENECKLIYTKSVPAYQVGKLLDILLQKPDYAFHGLVKALKNTKQRELARLLTRKKKSMHLSVKLKSFKTRHSTTTKAASRRFFEDIVRLMEEQWQEVSIRGTMVHEMSGKRFFQELLKMGTIEGFGMGCIYVALILSSLEALESLMGAISEETLQNAFMDTYFTPDLLEKHGVESADIEMTISSPEYEMCKEELIETEMQEKMEKLKVEGDVDRPLDEPAQEEESRHHSPVGKHDPKRLIIKSEFDDTEQLQIGEKLTKKIKPPASGLRSTKASRDPEYEELVKGVDRHDLFLKGEACKLVETTVKHERGLIYRVIGPRHSRLYLSRYTEATRRAPYQATSPQLELVEGGRRRKDNIYATNHKRRGKALIFGNQSTGYSSLTGGHAEQDALVGPLQDLGFDVESYLPDKTTLSTGFIVDKLWTVAKEDHTDADCIMCVVYQILWDVDELLHPFESDNCPSLAGKPKIFIIQGFPHGPMHCTPPEPDYLILQTSLLIPLYGFDELLTTALNEMIRKNGEEDFVHVCVEVMRALLEQIMKDGMSDLLEHNYVATTFTKDLYLLPAQGSSSKTVIETHQKEEARYLHTDPLTSKKQHSVATSSTKGVYPLQQRMESGDVVKKVTGEKDT